MQNNGNPVFPGFIKKALAEYLDRHENEERDPTPRKKATR
jgi:hypothetical protein